MGAGRVVELQDYSGRTLRIRWPPGVLGVQVTAPGCIRYILPRGYFVDRLNAAHARVRHGDVRLRYGLYLSGGHPSGCALHLGAARTWREVLQRLPSEVQG